MSKPELQQCVFCGTLICDLNIFCKTICFYIFENRFSERWKSTLTLTQRMRKFKFKVYQILPYTSSLISLFLIGLNFGFRNSFMAVTTTVSIGYLATFWWVIHGKEEFYRTYEAYHKGKRRESSSIIRMPEYVKLAFKLVLIAQYLAWFSTPYPFVSWLLVTVSQLFACFALTDSKFINLFPIEQPGNNELFYEIEGLPPGVLNTGHSLPLIKKKNRKKRSRTKKKRLENNELSSYN